MRRKIVITLAVCLMSLALAADAPATKVTVSTYPHADGTTLYYVNLNDGINPASENILVGVFSKAKEGDRIQIDIDSPGGDASSMANIIDAMGVTPATVSCNIRGWAASAAALIAWNCPNLTASKFSIVLYHKVATTPFTFIMTPRLTTNAIDAISRDLKNTDTLVKVLYLVNALQGSEIDDYDNGSNVIIGGEEVAQRHHKDVSTREPK